MHWILSIPKAFSLKETLDRSRPIRYPPFHIQATGRDLDRIERLSTGHTTALTLSRVQTGLVIQTSAQLLGSEIEECSQKVWRMLRLDETFTPFRRAARRSPELASVRERGARLLRGATLFEDVVTAVTTTWGTGGKPVYDKLVWLVNRYGEPLPSNPTRHAFPQPKDLIDGQASLRQSLPSELAEMLTRIARTFQTQKRQLKRLTQSLIDLEQLEADLVDQLHLPPESMGLVMLNLGRYDYVPTDPWARLRAQHYQAHKNGACTQNVRQFFEPWRPWGGLAYWCWNWSSVPMPNKFDVEVLETTQKR